MLFMVNDIRRATRTQHSAKENEAVPSRNGVRPVKIPQGHPRPAVEPDRFARGLRIEKVIRAFAQSSKVRVWVDIGEGGLALTGMQFIAIFRHG